MKGNGTPRHTEQIPRDAYTSPKGRVHLAVSRAWAKMQTALQAAALKKDFSEIDKLLAEVEKRIVVARELISQERKNP